MNWLSETKLFLPLHSLLFLQSYKVLHIQINQLLQLKDVLFKEDQRVIKLPKLYCYSLIQSVDPELGFLFTSDSAVTRAEMFFKTLKIQN